MSIGGTEWITPRALPPLRGDEPFVGMPGSVIDFWRFALSDLRMNNARGYLAEFIVATALELHVTRVEWANVDLEWEGIGIEVKSSAYLQAWDQARVSDISFSSLIGRKWDARSGYAPEASFKAAIYVFCVHKIREHERYDPLDIRDWDFYVVAREALVARGAKSIRLSGLSRLADPVGFSELAATVREESRVSPP